MLSRIHRLSLRSDFQRVFSRGMGSSTPLYTIRWLPNRLNVPRFGFVVANTISKKAVQRNLIRRRLRESVRKNLKTFTPPYDVVIIAKPPLLKAAYGELEPVVANSLETIAARPFYESVRKAKVQKK